MLGLVFLRRDSNTEYNTSLGTVLKAETIWLLGSILASAPAPDEGRPITMPLSSSFIGMEHVITILPDRSPACFSTSLTRDQCTASSTASACLAAPAGVPASAFAPASRANRFSLAVLRA